MGTSMEQQTVELSQPPALLSPPFPMLPVPFSSPPEPVLQPLPPPLPCSFERLPAGCPVLIFFSSYFLNRLLVKRVFLCLFSHGVGGVENSFFSDTPRQRSRKMSGISLGFVTSADFVMASAASMAAVNPLVSTIPNASCAISFSFPLLLPPRRLPRWDPGCILSGITPPRLISSRAPRGWGFPWRS